MCTTIRLTRFTIFIAVFFLPIYGWAKAPNILFIAIDDLRPAIGAYGDTLAITPNIDRVAAKGTLFKNAFASVPTCGASRASLLTGIRPTMHRFLTARTRVSVDTPDATTIPKEFKRLGYNTFSYGKVSDKPDDIPSHWSAPPWRPKPEKGKNLNYQLKENIEIAAKHNHKSYPYESADADDSQYGDGMVADKAVEKLAALAKSDKPFFLAVGFSKPHLPFAAPKKYWDMYPLEKIVLPNNYFRPWNVPKKAMHNLGELRTYYGVPDKGPVSDVMALKMIQGYYASTSFADAQLGKVLDALERHKLERNTIIVLWGDHGWHLGEHKLWHKHANFKMAIHSPLIISAPGFSAGQSTSAMAEFVDIFPTLAELADFAKPKQLQGESLVPHMKNPGAHKNTVAFSQWKNGTTMFTERYAYTEWFNKDGSYKENMLFDHKFDPDENVDISDRKENEKLVARLSKQLNAKRLSIK